MPVVQVESVTQVFGSGKTAVVALDRVNLRLEAGECVAVVGPSGSGKSTLLHTMCGLVRPTQGRVLLQGRDLTTLHDSELAALRRRHVGFVLQSFNLIPVLTAEENVALPLLLDGVRRGKALEQAARCLSRLGVDNLGSALPGQLSASEQQTVGIARALVAEPWLVLADEPTGNLDTPTGDRIAALLHQVAKSWGCAVLVATHDPRVAAYADRIVLLKDGKVVDLVQLEFLAATG